MDYPFPNFNGCTVEVLEWISNSTPHFTRCVITYLCSMVGFKLIHVIKRCYWSSDLLYDTR